MQIKNRIIKAEEIEWRNVKSLQPDDFKLPDNQKALRESILKHGVTKAYDVWQDPETQDIYWLDGHQRTAMFLNLIEEGYHIPDKIMAVFYDLKDKKEAISVLLSVFNQKQNAISEPAMIEWLEIEDIEIEDVPIETIHSEDRLVVRDLQFDKSDIDITQGAGEELENKYDDDDHSEDGSFEGSGKPEEKEVPNDPPARKDTRVPIFFNVEKVINSTFTKLKKIEGDDDNTMFGKLVKYYEENYIPEE